MADIYRLSSDKNAPVAVPLPIAVCPICGGELEAECSDFLKLMPDVNLYQADDVLADYVYCRDNRDHENGDWNGIYERVYGWLRRSFFTLVKKYSVSVN